MNFARNQFIRLAAAVVAVTVLTLSGSQASQRFRAGRHRSCRIA
jgi:hypothetical protein